MAIATVAAVLISVVFIVFPQSELASEVRNYQDALERQEEEVRNDLATAHGEERIRLENEKAEIARQLADVQAAYAERQKRIGELEASLARFSNDVDDDQLAEARTALEAGDFSLADALLAAIEARADVAVARAVVRRAILTPMYLATSIAYRADRRATHAPNNRRSQWRSPCACVGV